MRLTSCFVHRRRPVPSRRAVRGGCLPDGAPRAPGFLHEDRQLLHPHRLREGIRGYPHVPHAARRGWISCGYRPLFPEARRPGCDLRRLFPGYVGRQPRVRHRRLEELVLASRDPNRHLRARVRRGRQDLLAHAHTGPAKHTGHRRGRRQGGAAHPGQGWARGRVHRQRPRRIIRRRHGDLPGVHVDMRAVPGRRRIRRPPPQRYRRDVHVHRRGRRAGAFGPSRFQRPRAADDGPAARRRRAPVPAGARLRPV